MTVNFLLHPGERSGSWTIRPAEGKDYAAIEKLLKALHLPTQGVKWWMKPSNRPLNFDRLVPLRRCA